MNDVRYEKNHDSFRRKYTLRRGNYNLHMGTPIKRTDVICRRRILLHIRLSLDSIFSSTLLELTRLHIDRNTKLTTTILIIVRFVLWKSKEDLLWITKITTIVKSVKT